MRTCTCRTGFLLDDSCCDFSPTNKPFTTTVLFALPLIEAANLSVMFSTMAKHSMKGFEKGVVSVGLGKLIDENSCTIDSS